MTEWLAGLVVAPLLSAKFVGSLTYNYNEEVMKKRKGRAITGTRSQT